MRRPFSDHRSGGRLVRAIVLTSAVMSMVGACGDEGDSSVGPVGPTEPVGPVGPAEGDDGGVAGSGVVTIDVRSVTGIDRVSMLGEGSVVVTQGGRESLTVETDDNLLELIETDVFDGTLVIRTAAGVDIAPTASVVYRVGVVDLDGIVLAGAGSIEIEEWTTDAASIVLEGVGDIRIGDLESGSLDVELDGVGTIVIAGEVVRQDLAIGGVGEYDGAGLESLIATVEASGTGDVTIWATDALDIEATGGATVGYLGTPEVNQVTSDLATITPLAIG